MGKTTFTSFRQTGGFYFRMAVMVLLTILLFGGISYLSQKSAGAVDGRFGFTVVGSYPENLNIGYKIADASTAPTTGIVESLTFYIDGKASTTGSGTVTAAIYADAGGTPLAVTPTSLLGSSAPKTIPAGQAAGWVTFDLTSPVNIVAGQRYWLTLTAGGKTVVRVFTGSIVDDKIWAQNSSGATPTATFGSYSKGKGPLSVYANYTTTPSGQPMPSIAPAGWSRVFSDDFTTDIPSGQFPQATNGKWGAYNGFSDSSGNGYYNDDILSVSDGSLNMGLKVVDGVAQSAAPSPHLQTGGSWGGMPYGRYAVRFKVDDGLSGWAAAWLLWSDTNTWAEGEIDFPEGELDGNIKGFNHCVGNPSQNCQYASTNTPFAGGWYTAVIEWKPGSLKYILNDSVVLNATTSVPTASMHWVLQTETAYGKIPVATANGAIKIDWVTIDSYTP